MILQNRDDICEGTIHRLEIIFSVCAGIDLSHDCPKSCHCIEQLISAATENVQTLMTALH